MVKNEQTVYLFMDDSGKLTRNEHYCIYAGIAFHSNRQKIEFVNKYKSIFNDLKCKYCKQKSENCDGACFEIKSTSISPSDRRRILNLIKKFTSFAVVIRNDMIYDNIMVSKASRGRYIDFSQKLIIKEVIQYLISKGTLNASASLKIVINSDEQTTKSNGYYNLLESVKEELGSGIYNFNYHKIHKPIISGLLTVEVNYLDSNKSYSIQAADIIAGTVRHKVISSNDLLKVHQEISKFITVFKVLP